MRVIAVLVFCLIFALVHGQNFDKIHSLKNVSIEKVVSENVNDSFYVYTKLPDGYPDSAHNYPVLYLMDGDLLFPAACGIMQYLNGGGYVPQMIIVGIGYGTMDWRKGNQRSRDFTPIASEGRSFEGGGDKFLKFMTDELIPLIDEKYRTNKSERILMGHSLGGQFVLYSLLNSPHAFSKYISSSPFIFRLKDFYHKLLEKHAGEVNKYDNNLFVSYGENEDELEYKNTIENFVTRLKQKTNDKDKIELKILSDGEHFLNPPTALVFGLKWLFQK